MLRDAGFDVTATDMADVVLDRYREHFTEEQLDALAGGVSEDEWAPVYGGLVMLGVGLGVVAATAAAAL